MACMERLPMLLALARRARANLPAADKSSPGSGFVIWANLSEVNLDCLRDDFDLDEFRLVDSRLTRLLYV
ncbi:hypothetical protein WS62_24480 [Burkholderia sp. ABCPW 14]|nr:hypothetical protein WS62_24480 [Burkholderia sp. ABCPW 14]